mmetsp:Transcript_11132/g.32736  ORF Transcript_11132/g.32736 Transcript_11132/m.32736 type:complete len:244 (+) Transcript_11132:428-1159(+)
MPAPFSRIISSTATRNIDLEAAFAVTHETPRKVALSGTGESVKTMCASGLCRRTRATIFRRLARFSLTDDTRNPCRVGSNLSLGTARHSTCSSSIDSSAPRSTEPSGALRSRRRRWNHTSASPRVITNNLVAPNIARVRSRASSVGSTTWPRAPHHKSSSNSRPSKAHSNCCRSTNVLTSPALHCSSGTVESSACGYAVPRRKSSLTRYPRVRSQMRISSAKHEPSAVTSESLPISGASGAQP